jgi:gamma-glutamyl-gamma-aminobutyrate hydrolase PuuD
MKEARMKPLIGITMNLDVRKTRNRNILDQDYGRAVQQAGGIPVPVLGLKESIPDLAKQLDGFVFSGGDDIHPRFYKEKPLPGAGMTLSPDERTQFELALFKAVYRAKKPILAICGGEQLVNVAFKGTLYQDIGKQVPTPIKHKASRAGEKVFHPVGIIDGTLLSRIMGATSIRVRSSHHQGVKSHGQGLQISALSLDWVIEALEPIKNDSFLIAVQWHPEKTPNDRYTRKLFKAFINASKK